MRTEVAQKLTIFLSDCHVEQGSQGGAEALTIVPVVKRRDHHRPLRGLLALQLVSLSLVLLRSQVVRVNRGHHAYFP